MMESWTTEQQRDSVKVDRHGKAKILTHEELQLLFARGFTSLRDRVLFAIMLHTACRVNEAVTLRVADAYDGRGRVRAKLTFRKANTKGKLATRSIPVNEDLRRALEQYAPPARQTYLFPGQNGRPHLHPDSASWILREALRRVQIDGASTHSFRRTALTHMSSRGIPLRVIQEVSGHRTLDELYKYLEVTDEEVLGAVSSLAMLSPLADASFGKPVYPEANATELRERYQRDDLLTDKDGYDLIM